MNGLESLEAFKAAEKSFNLSLQRLLSQAREQAVRDASRMLYLAGYHEAADFLSGDNNE